MLLRLVAPSVIGCWVQQRFPASYATSEQSPIPSLVCPQTHIVGDREPPQMLYDIEYALIAAGAVVNKDVLAFALVAGVPAKQIGWICKCGISLKDLTQKNNQCAACGRTYRLTDNSLNLEKDI